MEGGKKERNQEITEKNAGGKKGTGWEQKLFI